MLNLSLQCQTSSPPRDGSTQHLASTLPNAQMSPSHLLTLPPSHSLWERIRNAWQKNISDLQMILHFFVRYLSMPSEKESAWSATTQKASSHCSVCTITKCLSHLIIYLEGKKKKKAQQTKLAQPIKERLSNWKLAVISIFAVLICACQCNLCIRKFLK